MIITQDKVPESQYINSQPSQFVSEKEKQSDKWIKQNLDYRVSIALAAYNQQRADFGRNYEIVKGVLTPEDFYEDPGVPQFVQGDDETTMSDNVEEALKLPAYVKDYSIMGPPINTIAGEVTKRPDNTYVKAFDDDSTSQEFKWRTEMMANFALNQILQRAYAKAAEEGVEINPEEIQQMAQEQLEEQLSNYTSQAEKYAAATLENLKLQFGLKEKSEEYMRDLLICAHPRYHIYEDSSAIGFNVEVLNGIQTYRKGTGSKFISNPLNPNEGDYEAGIISVMELSEIMERFPLTLKEIEHLHKNSQDAGLRTGEGQIGNGKTGIESIEYNTYHRYWEEQQMYLAALAKSTDDMHDLLGWANSSPILGDKFLVLQSYWKSKKKVGRLEYLDSNGEPQIMLVDENYKAHDHPLEIDLEWTWINQWYQGVRIGPDVYKCSPYTLLDYCPILGGDFEAKNTDAKSLVDLMKPFQVLYNVFMNKAFDFVKKDKGKLILFPWRHMPSPKEGDEQDAFEQFESYAKELGWIFMDDTTENTKVPSAFNQYQVLDASRANEILTYLNLAQAMKNECWELVGINRQRQGQMMATETATATNAALSQSYAQTEPWFAFHEQSNNHLYQAILDASLNIESKKETSTLSYLTTEGDRAFLSVSGEDLRYSDIHVLVTSRAEDAQAFRDMRSLAQPMLQNGASILDIANLYTTKSIRGIKDIYKKREEIIQNQQQQEMQLKQQQLDQQQAQFEQEVQMQEIQRQEDRANENYQKQLDRLSKERIAIISATGFGNVGSQDANADGVPDVMELQKIDVQRTQLDQNHQIALQELQLRRMELLNSNTDSIRKAETEARKIEAQDRKNETALKIAKENRTKAEMGGSKTKKK